MPFTQLKIETPMMTASAHGSMPMFDLPKLPEAFSEEFGGEVGKDEEARNAAFQKVIDEITRTGGDGDYTGNLRYSTAWLHLKWNSNCYVLYAEYYFEAWVTSTEDPNSERVPVDLLEIRWRHGETRGQEALENSAMIAKSDRVYGNVWSCDSDICLGAIATRNGHKWGAASPASCTWV